MLRSLWERHCGEEKGSTAEPVSGTLVNYPGIRRVNTRGLHQANKCMLMAAVAYNLKKLLKWQGTKANTAIKSLEKPLKNAFYFSIVFWRIEVYCRFNFENINDLLTLLKKKSNGDLRCAVAG